ncbi:hypothetical protein N9U73_01720 [Candidatus Pelagibacter bacterium]|nr:hypothetical protein [Candidatus Pelagibacter bacterium]
MEENIEKKQELKSRLIHFFDKNKFKFFILISLIVIAIFALSLFQINVKKKNSLIAEKYIQAGIYLANKKNADATLIFEEIIESKNKFYSILSLNTILEKKLLTDKEKILQLFEKTEKIIETKDQRDLIKFKKALFLINNSEFEKGKKILQDIASSKSDLKFLAEEILSN